MQGEMGEKQIFFDRGCKLCRDAIKKIQVRDREGLFEYFPLDSARAKEVLTEELRRGDTLVLLEGEKVWVRAKAVFRILGLLGSKWGWLIHVPGLDLGYRLIAHNRHLF